MTSIALSTDVQRPLLVLLELREIDPTSDKLPELVLHVLSVLRGIGWVSIRKTNSDWLLKEDHIGLLVPGYASQSSFSVALVLDLKRTLLEE